MLQFKIFPQDETFDEASGKFLAPRNGIVVRLEHSLVSVSKWESKYEVPFLTTSDKTVEQTLDYIRYMIDGDELPPEVFQRITPDHIRVIDAYIQSKQTATWFSQDEKKSGPAREIITAELIYYWMIAFEIPVEFQHWHLNKLLTLIKVCNVKNAPKEKQNPTQAARNRAQLNAERKKKFNTTG